MPKIVLNKAILIDVGNAKIIDETVNIYSLERVDNMYYSTNRGMIPIIYLYKPEHKKEIQKYLNMILEKRKELRKFEHHMVITKFMSFRP